MKDNKMNIRTYSGKSMDDALSFAKKEMGPNVIVLESKKVLQKGLLGNKPSVELTVTVDDTPPAPPPAPHQAASPDTGTYNKNGVQDTFNNVLSKMRQQVDESPVTDSSATLVGEITQLREELQDMTRRFRKIVSPEFPEPFAEVFEKLTNTGVDDEHARSIVRRTFLQLDGNSSITLPDVMKAVYKEVDRLFTLTPDEDKSEIIQGQKVIALIGGTGVGKTTTIMKMAANPEFYGKKNVGIISIDTYRAGALAPLEAFAKIAGIPVHEARSVGEAHEKLRELKDADVVFIDTPGRGLYFENYMAELSQYLTALRPTETLLVMAANIDIEDLYLTAGMATIQEPTGLVFTKLDETGNPGKILSVMKELELTTHVLCDGQAVPNNVAHGNTEELWGKIFDEKIK